MRPCGVERRNPISLSCLYMVGVLFRFQFYGLIGFNDDMILNVHVGVATR